MITVQLLAKNRSPPAIAIADARPLEIANRCYP
jgi:hypothetical protein